MSDISTKLTYLNTTKQLLKTEINKINNVLDDNSTFRSYPQELFNGYLDILNNGTDTLWNNLEKVSQTGTEAVLEGVETAPMKVELQGNTSQDGTPTSDTPVEVKVVTGENVVSVSGKNLYDVNDIYQFADIVSVDNEDWITVTYDNTSGSSAKFFDFKTKTSKSVQEGATYKLIIEVKNVTGTGKINFASKQAIGQTDTTKYSTFGGLSAGVIIVPITMKTDFTGCATFLNSYGSFSAGQSGSITFRMSVVKDNVDISNYVYEPYSKTDYPINLVSKNLLTGTFRQGNSSGDPINRRIFADDNYYVEEGKTYILSTNLDVSQFNYALNISWDNFPTSVIFDSKWLTINQYIFTVKMSGHIGIPVRKADESALTPTDIQDVWFKLEETIYGEKTSLELCKINTYKDYFHKDSGKWYVHKEIGKVILSSNANISNLAFGTNSYSLNLSSSYFMAVDNAKIMVLSNKYKGIPYNDRTQEISNSIYQPNFNNRIDFRNTNFTSVEDFKTNNIGTIVYLVLATPTEEEITNTTLISQLEAIANAKSVKDKTYITQTNDELPFILDVEAIKEYEVN